MTPQITLTMTQEALTLAVDLDNVNLMQRTSTTRARIMPCVGTPAILISTHLRIFSEVKVAVWIALHLDHGWAAVHICTTVVVSHCWASSAAITLTPVRGGLFHGPCDVSLLVPDLIISGASANSQQDDPPW